MMEENENKFDNRRCREARFGQPCWGELTAVFSTARSGYYCEGHRYFCYTEAPRFKLPSDEKVMPFETPMAETRPTTCAYAHLATDDEPCWGDTEPNDRGHPGEWDNICKGHWDVDMCRYNAEPPKLALIETTALPDITPTQLDLIIHLLARASCQYETDSDDLREALDKLERLRAQCNTDPS